MQITYNQWKDEVNFIKESNNFSYLTKRKCKQLYGWDWKFNHGLNVTVIITFHNPSAESFYKLKWST